MCGRTSGSIRAAVLLVSVVAAAAAAHCPNEGDFDCGSGNGTCVAAERRCDGRVDCADASDEFDCDRILCRIPQYFRCRNGLCVPASFVCDGENDCLDGSDESEGNCTTFRPEPGANSSCTRGEWMCKDRLCIPDEWVCNGENDCLDGSDESLGCTLNIDCDGFRCGDGHCLPVEWRCDGHPDCHDASDETTCDVVVDVAECTADRHLHLCWSDNRTCVDLKRLCDGKSDCPGGSDEGSGCISDVASCLNQRCSHECVRTPKGPMCLCPAGYAHANSSTCVDVDECRTVYGACDQKCRNNDGSYECLCADGYLLQADGRTCKARGGEALMLFSTKTEIRAYFLTSRLYYSVASGLKQAVGVAFDGRRRIYWTDIGSGDEAIVRADEDGSKRELVVTAGLGAPEDLAVDWVTGNVYFTDAEMRHVAACDADGDRCAVLVSAGVHKPRAIALDPTAGLMYWSDWGSRPEIARARMDGTEDASFVSNDVRWPNGLAIDAPNYRLYWTDGKLATLESVLLDGTDRRVVLAGVVRHPYAVAVFEDRLYWSDWATRSVQSCDKFTGKNHRTLVKEKKGNHVYGLRVFHSSAVAAVGRRDPCASSGCGPENLCVLRGPDSFSCRNSTSDNHRDEPVLAVAAGQVVLLVRRARLGRHRLEALPISFSRADAMTYDPVADRLLVSDGGAIFSIDVADGGVGERRRRIVEGDAKAGRITRMEVDPRTGNLYWLDEGRDVLEVRSGATGTRKALLIGQSTASFALLPDGVAFVAFRLPGGGGVHVDRLHLDEGAGSASHTHVAENGIVGPDVAMTYDARLRRVFWADAHSGKIESSSADGDDRHTFRAIVDGDPVSLAALGDDLFWTNAGSRRLFWADSRGLGSGAARRLTLGVSREGGRRMQLCAVASRVAANNNNNSSSHPCLRNNGGCSQLCFADSHPREQGRRCDCGEGYALNSADGTTCEPVDCVGRFRCSDGACIERRRRCDAHFDCPDGSDERDCPKKSEERTGCPAGERPCGGDHGSGCVSTRLLCDGIKDCADGSDEADCETVTCSSVDQFRCDSGNCVPSSWKCDGEFDCADGSDERVSDCDDGRGVAVDEEADENENESSSSSSSDESDSSVATAATAIACRHDEFECGDGDGCVPVEWICDGRNDCRDGSDETTSNCARSRGNCTFRCHSSGRCLPERGPGSVCDGRDDCPDGSDEGGACATACSSGHPCAGECRATPSGPSCTCADGFRLLGDGASCEDEDECATSKASCAHTCRNLPGSFACGCHEGFELRADRRSCKARGAPLSVAYALSSVAALRVATPRTDGPLFDFETETLSYVSAIDVDSTAGLVYFADERTGAIGRVNLTDRRVAAAAFVRDLQRPRAIAVDWITGLAYVADGRRVKACDVARGRCAVVATAAAGETTVAVAVDAAAGALFYAATSRWQFDAPSSRVVRCQPDGSSPTEIEGDDGNRLVTALAVDAPRRRLLVADARRGRGRVLTADYDGGDRRVAVPKTPGRPLAVAAFEDDVFVLTTEESGLLYRCSSAGCRRARSRTAGVSAFALDQRSRQPPVPAATPPPRPCNDTCDADPEGVCVRSHCLCADGKPAPCPHAHVAAAPAPAPAPTDTAGGAAGVAFATAAAAAAAAAVAVVGYRWARNRAASDKFDVSLRFRNPTYYGLHCGEKPSPPHDYSDPVLINNRDMQAAADVILQKTRRQSPGLINL